MTGQPAPQHAPISVLEKLEVAGLLLVCVLVPLLSWWTCHTAKRSEDPVVEVFD
jgi:hypothetical protein